MIRTPQAHLQIAAATHQGMAGRQNEDRFAVSSYKLSEKNPTDSAFLIVSDGIGGHRAGEVAAEMAVETISHMVAQSNGRDPLAVLDNAIQVTSDAIAARARDDTQRLGMGTTCACAWVVGSQLYLAWVGDSRIYLHRGGKLIQLTIDHTWVQEAVEKGILDPRLAHEHPNAHVIRRYLGAARTPRADVRLRLAGDESDTQARSNQGLRLQSGDLILLCTDGLTDKVSDEQIGSILGGLPLQDAADKLVALACEYGGRDNITVVLALVPAGSFPERPPSRFWKRIVFAVAGLLGLVLLVTLGIWVVLTFLLPPSPSPFT